MRVYEEKIVKENKQILSKIGCNKCGKSIDVEPIEKTYADISLFHEFIVSFGLDSDFDMEVWKFDLCESCLLEFVSTFKIMPEWFANRAKYPEKVFLKWKETGEYDSKVGWTEEEINEYELRRKRQQEELEEIKRKLKNMKSTKEILNNRKQQRKQMRSETREKVQEILNGDNSIE